MDEEVKLILEWLVKNLSTLRNSGDKWQLILHGGSDGRIVREVMTTGELVPSKHRSQIKEQK